VGDATKDLVFTQATLRYKNVTIERGTDKVGHIKLKCIKCHFESRQLWAMLQPAAELTTDHYRLIRLYSAMEGQHE
jgi:hypothetical protein